MKTIIDEIIRLGNAAKERDGNDDLLSRPTLPANKAELNKLKKQFGNKIPLSFTKLLSIYNGINYFDWLDVSLLSAKYLIEHPNLAEDWEIEDWGAINFKSEQLFIIGQSENDSHLIAFDVTNSNSQEEHKVINFDSNGILEVYENLEEYLSLRLKWFENNFGK